MKFLQLLLILTLFWCFVSCDDMPIDIDLPGNIELFEYQLEHVSGIPNFEGTPFSLYVREKIKDSTLFQGDFEGKVVLLIHATITPSISTYDLGFEDYSMMDHLAKQGLDVFTFDLSGYGKSSYPAPMNDSCNLSQADKETLGLESCPASYPYAMTTIYSELTEIHTVVEFIKRTRNVNKVSLFGLSLGGIRSLNYTMTHPDNVDRVSVQGVARYLSFDITPTNIPAPGFPIQITTEQDLFNRLEDDVYTPTQRNELIHQEVWNTLSNLDTVGMSWGNGAIRYPSLMLYGFQRSDIEKMTTPCLVISGENDKILNPLLPIRSNLGLALYNDMLTADQKIHLTIENTGHVIPYDYGATYLRRALSDWFLNQSIDGRATGEGRIDRNGRYVW